MPVELTMSGVASDGRGVGRDSEGRVVFVDSALPGERVVVEIEDERSRWARARVAEVIEPSPDRVRPPCRHVDEGCGGCQWQHVRPEAARRLKERILAETARRIGHLELPALEPTIELAPWSYRTTLRLAVGAAGRPAHRAWQSHHPVASVGCVVAHPLLADLLQITYPGASEVLLRCGARTGDRMARARPARGVRGLPHGVSRHAVTEEAAGRTWRISAASFFQSRPDGADALAGLVSAAASRLGAPGRAADLYAGVGLFAGVLAGLGWSVTAVEGSAPAVADARANLAGLDAVAVRSAVESWRPGAGADLVVADPSRAGLGRGGVAAVAACHPARVVLVSCDAAAMARDLALLRQAGFAITSVTPVDLFPQSFHVEVVTILDRLAG